LITVKSQKPEKTRNDCHSALAIYTVQHFPEYGLAGCMHSPSSLVGIIINSRMQMLIPQ